MRRIKHTIKEGGCHTSYKHTSNTTMFFYKAAKLLFMVLITNVSPFAPSYRLLTSSHHNHHQHHDQPLSRIKHRQHSKQQHNMKKSSSDQSIDGNNIDNDELVEKIKLPSETVEPNNININNIRTTHKTLLTTLLLSLTIIFSTPLAPHANAGFGPSGGATTSSPPNLVTPTQLFSKDDNFDFGSNPNTKKKRVELDVESPSSTKKLKQLIGSSLNTGRLEEFSAQLDDITQSLLSIISSEDDEEVAADTTATADTTTSTTTTSIQTQSSTTSNLSIEERETILQQSTKSTKNKELRQAQQAELQRLQVLKQQIANQELLLSKLEAQPYWFNFLAAFVGSVASTCVMHPLDTIKTRLQVSGGKSRSDSGLSGGGGVSGSSAKKLKAGKEGKESSDDDDDDEEEGDIKEKDKDKDDKGEVKDKDKEQFQQQKEEQSPIIVGYNIMSLYEGLGSNILKEGPPSALYLGVYESVKYALLPQFGSQSLLLVYLLAGAAGETCGSIVRAPAEAIKSTVQTTYCTALEACGLVFGTSASRANVVRAWSASLWRDVPFGAIQLAIFELTKR